MLILKRFILFMLLGLYSISSFAIQADTSDAPRKALAKLDTIIGTWSSTMSISQDKGETWSDYSPDDVLVEKKLKGLLIQQTTASPSSNGWDMVASITYDQYRKLYRVTVMDDTWGLMDIYQGDVNEQGALVIDNLTSKTYFPGPKDNWLAFRLTLGLGECSRESSIDVTLDEGKQWIPYITYRYKRLDNESCDLKQNE